MQLDQNPSPELRMAADKARMREGTLLRRSVAAAAITGALTLWLFAVGLVQVSISPVATVTRSASVGSAIDVAASSGTSGSVGGLSSDPVPSAFTDGSGGTGNAGSGRSGRGSNNRGSELGRQLLVDIPHDLAMTSRPGGGRTIGVVPADSRFYGVGTVAWVQRISENGRFGKLSVPYDATGRSGWIPLKGLHRRRTRVAVDVSLSRHEVTVERGDRVLFRTIAATGAPASPTPRGRYFVTDRVPFPSGGYLGTFAFGLSGVQPHLPAGWSGGDQIAIHGTDDPSSIGRSVSAGCIRISEHALDRLRPLLRLGTPVVVGR